MIPNILLLIAGSALIAFVLFDLSSTTISLSSVRGPLSSRLSRMVWRAGRRSSGTRLAVFQRGAGPLLVVTITLSWLMTLTLGWSLIFSVDGALEQAASPGQQTSPVRWVDSVFFVFGSLIGRGSSNLSPSEVLWSSVVALMTLTGVGLITLALAWILPVVSAVVQKRALAAKISTLGGTPQDMIERSWNGSGLGDFNLHLLPVIDELTLLAQRHLAYPVIHYFHSSDDRTAIGPRVAALDEALTILEAAGLDRTERGTGLDRSVTRPLRQAISDYLSTLEYVFITTTDDTPPPPPRTDDLVQAGVLAAPIDDEIAELCDDLADRRRLLDSYVRHDGWTWDAVTQDRAARTEEPDQTEEPEQ